MIPIIISFYYNAVLIISHWFSGI